MIDDMDVILERLTLSSHEKTLVRADAGFGVSLSDEDVGDLPSRSQRIPIVTGNFGKNNQPLIASTAVAAQATVRCRIRPFFDWDSEGDGGLGDGFVIFGDCPHVVHQKSEAGPWVRNIVGDDLIEGMVSFGPSAIAHLSPTASMSSIKSSPTMSCTQGPASDFWFTSL